MTLKVDYKQTELGPIPHEWDVKKLADLASFRTGPFGSSLHKSDYVESGIPVINPMHIAGGELIPTSDMSVTEVAATRLKDFRLMPGNVVIGRRGDMGRCAVVRQQHKGWLCGTGSLIIRCSAQLVPDFLQPILASSRVVSQLHDGAVGSTMVNLNQAGLGNVTIQVPSVAEQRAIADALSDADALIDKLDQLIAKKRDIKLGVMEQLLTGKQRLRGFSGTWSQAKIGEFTKCVAGGTPSTKMAHYWGGPIRWMNSGELHLKIVSEVEGRITNEGLAASSSKVVPVGCVLIGLAGQGKTRGTVATNTVELCTNQSIAAIYPSCKCNSKYLFYNLDARYNELRSLSTGDGGRGGLNLAIIRALRLPLPSIEEQSAIVSVLVDIDDELSSLKARRDKAVMLKQAMMQELLTGRTRLV